MQYWLVKSEPDEYSFADLEAEERVGMWEGVRNYQARNNLRKMEKDDLLLFYHSRKGLEVVGIARVVREAYPDPSAGEGSDWSAVDLEPVRRLPRPVSLKAIKAEPELGEMALVRNSRLSVSSVRPEEFQRILEMGGLPTL